MATTRNGDVELYYETFGDPADPVLLLVNGFGSQCINFKEAWCERFVAEGFHVVRFDNRDVGLSTHTKDMPEYRLADMADDGFAVLDAVGAARAHVAGWSMGGMIVQSMAIARPERLLSMTSVMSSPGGDVGAVADPDAMAALTAPAPKTRQESIDQYVAAQHVIGTPAFIDDERLAADAAAIYDRSFDPGGRARQMNANMKSPSRQDALRSVTVPTLVMHGDKDRLVPIEAGRLTAELIPGATFTVIEGMGHDYPPQLWDEIVGHLVKHMKAATS
jgi:pimeloyl-ACP methyl ester carboxylesterase